MTPPELARKSGTSFTPASAMILSPSGVVGPFAPSTTYFAKTLPAVSLLMTPSRAQGNRKSHLVNRTSSTFSQFPTFSNPFRSFLGSLSFTSKAFSMSMPFSE